MRSLWLHESSSWVNWQLCLLDDLLQHSIPCEQLLQLYTPSSSTMCSEWTAKGFISMQVAHLVAIWPSLALPLQILVDNTFPRCWCSQQHNPFHRENQGTGHVPRLLLWRWVSEQGSPVSLIPSRPSWLIIQMY